MYRLIFLLIFSLFFVSAANAEIDPMLDLDVPPDVSFQFPDVPAAIKNIPRAIKSVPENVKAIPENVQNYQLKKGTTSEYTPKKTKAEIQAEQEKGIKGFFNKIKNLGRKPKQRPEFDSVGGGYRGVLPKVEQEFGYKKPKSSTVKDKGNKAEDYLPEEFQKSKIEDPLFLDVILNKERPSAYTVDMLRVMKFLETFRVVIQNHESLQKFNANVNLLDLHARRIENLYGDKPEGMSPSYWLLLDLAYKAKVLGNLKYDANYYSKFSPVQGTKYDPQNILLEDTKLLSDLDKTVFAIRQLNN